MGMLTSTGYSTITCVAAAILAGCGGSQLSVGSADTGQARLQERVSTAATEAASASKSEGYKATPPLLYVANATPTDNDVRVYHVGPKDPTPIATITNRIEDPNGDCIDRQGTLYVTNDPINGPGWVSEYPPGKTTPSEIIKDGVSTPAFCAIDAKGNLWVTNIGVDDVAEYAKNSKKPQTILTKGLTRVSGIAIDHSGNIYVGNLLTSATSNIVVYAPGSNSPSRTITDGITWPAGMTVDANGTLYVTDVEQSNVEEYRSGQDEPFQTITDSMHQPAGVTVTKNGVLYVANLESKYSSVVEFRLGSLKPLRRKISNGLFNPVGVAYYPPLLP
jgi:sugar lactone lactonase YvrE